MSNEHDYLHYKNVEYCSCITSIGFEQMSKIGKQAKVLTKQQIEMVAAYIRGQRNARRNTVVFLLSARAGLRAKEISGLKWGDVVDSDGAISDSVVVRNEVSKGGYGSRRIYMAKDLAAAMEHLKGNRAVDINQSIVASSRTGKSMSAQVIVNWFQGLYGKLGLDGCSSHSGRRTAITNWARKIGTVGGSINDVRQLAGHSSLHMTQSYIEFDSESSRRVVDLV